jgi:hypothetical protein
LNQKPPTQQPLHKQKPLPLAKMTLMKVAVMAALFALFCLGGAADIGSLVAQLDDPLMKEIIGSMRAEFQSQIEAERKDKEALQNKTQNVQAENVALRADMQAQIDAVKKDKEALQNKTQVVEAELRQENVALRVELTEVRSALYQFSNKTKTNIQQITVRLDHCEAKTFAEIMEHRRTQEQSSVCGPEALESMLAVCCDSRGPAGNGHRLLQNGCDSLPPMCSLQCSAQFISFFENCQGQPLMEGFSAEDMAQWTAFYSQCQEVEQSAAEMGVLQPVNVKMFRILISSDVAQSQAEMFGNGGQTQPIIGPMPEFHSPPPSPSPSSPADLEQYHAQCTTANILTCVPTCNATHHGYELLATIDGTDTKFSCSLANLLYSWLGAAALGGFLGENVAAFVSAVISGAAGIYVLTLVEDADVGTDLVVQPGQNVIISGDASLAEAPSWGIGGFTVGDMGSLSISRVRFGSTSTTFVVTSGSLSLANTAMLEAVLGGAMTQLSGVGGTARLSQVSMLPANTVMLEVWEGIISHQTHYPYAAITDLTSSPAYVADTPTHSGVLSGQAGDLFEMPSDAGDNYGARLTTYFRAPQTGYYVFVIAADDRGELWLGTNELTAELIASTLCTGARQWTTFPDQTSAPLMLEEGRYYYLKALMKEAGGGDNLAVGVTLPDGLNLRPIPVRGYLFGTRPDTRLLSGTLVVNEDGSRSTEGSLSFDEPAFIVTSGPCTVSHSARCVGRADGYGPSEDCTIAVSGGAGVLGGCGVFDVRGGGQGFIIGCTNGRDNRVAGCTSSCGGCIWNPDFITLPDGSTRTDSDCPVGALLTPGDSVAWHSNRFHQGSLGSGHSNGCEGKELCGLPYAGSSTGLGGGWQICFRH